MLPIIFNFLQQQARDLLLFCNLCAIVLQLKRDIRGSSPLPIVTKFATYARTYTTVILAWLLRSQFIDEASHSFGSNFVT